MIRTAKLRGFSVRFSHYCRGVMTANVEKSSQNAIISAHNNDGLARYVTVDRWSSAEAYAAFRHAARERYDALDRAGSLLTEAERCLGEFTEVAD